MKKQWYISYDFNPLHMNLINIAVTHSHFFQWKGKRIGKTDLQIWSTSNDWFTSDEMK